MLHLDVAIKELKIAVAKIVGLTAAAAVVVVGLVMLFVA
jgi:hypothetical protein